jgi:hypothetical protein
MSDCDVEKFKRVKKKKECELDGERMERKNYSKK